MKRYRLIPETRDGKCRQVRVERVGVAASHPNLVEKRNLYLSPGVVSTGKGFFVKSKVPSNVWISQPRACIGTGAIETGGEEGLRWKISSCHEHIFIGLVTSGHGTAGGGWARDITNP